jgi:hypothetical protein
MKEQDYFDGYITFYGYNGHWNATLTDTPCGLGIPSYKVHIPIPLELCSEQLEGEIKIGDKT